MKRSLPKNVQFYRQMHTLVKKIKRRTYKKVKVYESGDFFPGDFRVLSALDPEKGMSIGDIARRWTMEYSNITNIVNKLVKLGYALKKKDEKDKRVALVYITPEGDKIREEVFKDYEKSINEILENVDKEKIDIALEVVNSILEEL